VRLWSIHPQYLDSRGLVAVWREALLAQAVLLERTRGYTHHPQLQRFRAVRNPQSAIAAYLRAVHDEAENRGYRFDVTKIGRLAKVVEVIPVSRRQIQYEWQHLQGKLSQRDPEWLRNLGKLRRIAPHPMFVIVPGEIEPWEKL